MSDVMDLLAGNGGAVITGVSTNSTTRDEAIQQVVSGAVTLGLEEARKASGKSWFAFYGDIAWKWIKKNWLWLLIPCGTVVIVVLVFRKRKPKKQESVKNSLYKRK